MTTPLEQGVYCRPDIGRRMLFPMIVEDIPPDLPRLSRADSFSFRCHEGLACFNTCCRAKDLPLTPYDLLRLGQGLGTHSDEVLAKYSLYRMDPRSGFPVVSLRMREEPEKRCPFLEPGGCSVYSHRPTACRIYPLARASRRTADDLPREEFFFRLDTPHCLGGHKSRVRSIGEWLADQGLEPYLAMNDRMLDLVMHPGRRGRDLLSEEQLQLVFVSCYNLDVFRDLLFHTDLGRSAGFNPETETLLRQDDTALLDFAFEFLSGILFS